MKAYSARIRALLQECRNYTKEHGVEYGIVASPEGVVLVAKPGTSTYVQFDQDERHIMTSSPGCLLLHSHPTESTLSMADLKFSYLRKMPIYAITPSGSVFLSKGVYDPVSFVNFKNATVKVARAMVDAMPGGEYDVESNTFGAWEHDVLMEATKRGLIHYAAFNLSLEFLKTLSYARKLEAKSNHCLVNIY